MDKQKIASTGQLALREGREASYNTGRAAPRAAKRPCRHAAAAEKQKNQGPGRKTRDFCTFRSEDQGQMRQF